VPLRDELGIIGKWYGTSTDIDDRKQAEALLAELTRVARLMTMGELTTSIAHEIVQPLSAVVTNGNTCLHWLEDKTLDLTKARAAAARAVRDAERASDIITRIRALMTKSKTQKVQVDMNGLIREVLALTYNELVKRQVSTRTVLATALPPVFGDPVQLQQLILNLIMNGIEAMNEVAGRPKELTIETRGEATDQVLVEVRDSGVGLNPEAADQIFNAFFTTKPEGTGMGLAICRSIVEAHGGRIWAKAGSPHGTVFQFTLPTNDTGKS
jgi:signal transduction histidine kinase